ncbi:DedA family protein [Streptomyces sp. ST2-7A]|uniref:DedA family protein n=1 Tax=Streptomyces sp. ST2-7A TaxID=2907214 RepID=UPI001F2FD58F|nr:VTT domain-containing protein [Streptomyces sp. ST2-7A]MCE7081337.1 VTT domain-containing protein [Streptomyces sp. ST2-7A]
MPETFGILLYAPWIYVAVMLCVLLDVFLPLLPSGALVVAAAAIAAGTAAEAYGLPGPVPGTHIPEVLLLLLCAASASIVGDLVAYRVALHGGRRLEGFISRSRRLVEARARLGEALARGGGPLVIVARFAPAGRAVVSLGAGASRRRQRDFLPWSAVAAVVWAGYSVGLGYLGVSLLGGGWPGTLASLAALLLAGAFAGRLLRRRSPAPAAATG